MGLTSLVKGLFKEKEVEEVTFPNTYEGLKDAYEHYSDYPKGWPVGVPQTKNILRQTGRSFSDAIELVKTLGECTSYELTGRDLIYAVNNTLRELQETDCSVQDAAKLINAWSAANYRSHLSSLDIETGKILKLVKFWRSSVDEVVEIINIGMSWYNPLKRGGFSANGIDGCLRVLKCYNISVTEFKEINSNLSKKDKRMGPISALLVYYSNKKEEEKMGQLTLVDDTKGGLSLTAEEGALAIIKEEKN